jgi:hypothetical protein
MAAVYRLTSYDFTQLRLEAIRARLERWRGVWAAVEVPRLRLISRTVPMAMDRAIKRARRREAGCEDADRIEHLRQYAGLLRRAGDGPLFGIEHFLVFPTLDDEEARVVANVVISGLGLHGVAVGDLPPLLPARYQVGASLLEPLSGAHPLFSILVSHDLSGEWDYAVYPRILQRPGVVLSIDVLSHNGSAAYQRLDRAEQLLRGLSVQLGTRAALDKLQVAYQQLAEGVRAGDAIHQVVSGVLVRGRTEEELRRQEDEVRSAGAGHVHFRRVDGLSGELFRALFTSGPSSVPPRLRHNMTSKGMAVASGTLGLRKRQATEGILWGISGSSPFFWDGFGPDLNEPNHGVVLGATGSGKTVSTFATALREMNVMGSQVVVMEPMGNCRRLVDAVGQERASYNPLSLSKLRFNPVEVLYGTRAEQAAHLALVTSLLLDRPLEEDEEIALDRASSMIYEGVTPETPSVNQPRIQDLVWALRHCGAESWLADASRRLGSVLEQKFVRGSQGTIFNVTTEKDWRLRRDLTAFDFQDIPEKRGLRRLLYYLVLSTIRREAHRQARSRRRIVIIDEFRALSSHEALAQQVALMYKTFRTLGVGIWALEQDVITFVGAGQGRGTSVDVEAGTYILANSTFGVILAQRPVEAQRLPTFFPQLTRDHVRTLMSLSPQRNPGDKGRGVVVLPNQVHPIKFVLTQSELASLGGS